jgi:hypothetical protein
MPWNEKRVDLTIYVVDMVWFPDSYSCHFESKLLLQKHNVELEPKVLIVNSFLYKDEQTLCRQGTYGS